MGGDPFIVQNDEDSADSSKVEGTPQGRVVLVSFLGPQMWQKQVVFTMRSRVPRWGSKGRYFGSYLRGLRRVKGSIEPKRT